MKQIIFFISLSLVSTCLGQKSALPAQKKVEKAEVEKVTEHEKLALKWLDASHGVLYILLSIEDNASAKKATEKLDTLAKQFDLISKELAKLNPPSAELKAHINSKMEGLDKALQKRHGEEFANKIKTMTPEQKGIISGAMQRFYQTLDKHGHEMKRHFGPEVKEDDQQK